jgi:hypothetical protein
MVGTRKGPIPVADGFAFWVKVVPRHDKQKGTTTTLSSLLFLFFESNACYCFVRHKLCTKWCTRESITICVTLLGKTVRHINVPVRTDSRQWRTV